MDRRKLSLTLACLLFGSTTLFAQFVLTGMTAGRHNSPTIVTVAASSITQTAATLNGTANPNGLTTTASYRYGVTSAMTSSTTPQSMGSGSSPASIGGGALSGLACNTVYFFQATGSNAQGIRNGSILSFQTSACSVPPTAPTVTTTSASSIGQTTATLNGTVNPNGAATSGNYQYGTTTGYGSTTPVQTIGSGSTAVALAGGAVTGLSCNLVYHFRATATNGGGTSNGSDLTFTTSACTVPPVLPTVTTTSATGVGQSGATMNGSVNPNGFTSTGSFVWGTTTAYGQSTGSQSLGAGSSPVTLTNGLLSGLSCGTTYHFRAVGTNAAGTVNGSDSQFATSTCQGTIMAASCNLGDVRTAINSAVDGQTVAVPAGTCTWASGLFLSAQNITLQGAGAGVTTIINGTTAANWSATINWATPNNGHVRLTGFTFDSGTVGGTAGGSYQILMTGSSNQIRVDHNEFFMRRSRGMIWSGYLRGLADHNSFHINGFGLYGFFAKHETWLNANESYCAGYSFSSGCGDTSWATTVTPGSSDAIYVEDNTFDNGTGSFVWVVDGDFGQRIVYRFNTFTNSLYANHGTETDGRPRGALWHELYDNQFIANNPAVFNGWPAAAGTRSGTGMAFDNAMVFSNGASINRFYDLTTLRQADSSFRGFPTWGRCGVRSVSLTRNGTTVTGTSPWTGVYSTGSIINIAGAGTPFNGNFTAFAVDTDHFTYTTTNSGPTSSSGSISSPFDGNVDSTGYRCLDQAGAGPGDHTITGLSPTPAPSNEILLPVYTWLNLRQGVVTAAGNSNPANTVIVEDRDFYNQNASFNGTSGIGVGVLAARPSTCTTGVGYWATDQGEWNSLHAGADGQFYKCTATNTWTLYYTPFTYPYPWTP